MSSHFPLMEARKRASRSFSDTSSSEVLARVAFQFARLYLEAYGENRKVNDFLTDLDKKLDTIIGDEK